MDDHVGPAAALRRWQIVDWAHMPALARTFIVLTFVAVVVRTLWALLVKLSANDGGGPFQSPFDLGDLFILLPAIIVVRRPTAASDTPWVVGGAIILAVFTMASGALGPFLFRGAIFEPLFVPTSAQFVESAVLAVGWVAIGYGLARLNPTHPAAVTAGFANLAGGAFLVAAVVVTVDSLLALSRETFVRLDVGASLLSTGAEVVPLLAYAYLARCVVRGLDDPGRLERATRLAAAGVLLHGLGSLLRSLLGSIEGQTGFRGVPIEAFDSFASMADIGVVLLVVAFALGLADPLRPMAKDWEAAAAR